MILDLIVTNSDDGYTAIVPSIPGCDNWAHKEDDVIKSTVEFVFFYLNLPKDTEMKIDMARKEKNRSIYKLIFEKDHN